MKDITGNHISKEINYRILAIREAISSEINTYLSVFASQIKFKLEDISASRVKEICDENITQPLTIVESRLPKSESQRKSHDFTSDFLENMSKEYAKYQTPQNSSSFQLDFSGPNSSFTNSKSKPPARRSNTPKSNLPTVNVASTLQGFLNFEENSKK